MLSLQNAGKRFGPRVLFTEANWLIRSKEKTALVGANGTGKSTLMKVLAGLESLDYGTMQLDAWHEHRIPSSGRPAAERAHRV